MLENLVAKVSKSTRAAWGRATAALRDRDQGRPRLENRRLENNLDRCRRSQFTTGKKKSSSRTHKELRMNDTNTSSQKSRNEFIDKMKERLDDLDEKIDELKEEGDKLEGEAKKEYENRLHDLREKRREAKRKMDEVEAAGEEKWQQFKDEAEHAWKALGNSFNYFKSHFK